MLRCAAVEFDTWLKCLLVAQLAVKIEAAAVSKHLQDLIRFTKTDVVRGSKHEKQMEWNDATQLMLISAMAASHPVLCAGVLARLGMFVYNQAGHKSARKKKKKRKKNSQKLLRGVPNFDSSVFKQFPVLPLVSVHVCIIAVCSAQSRARTEITAPRAASRVCASIIHGDSDQLLVYWQRARTGGHVCLLVCSPATVSLIVCLRGGRRGQTERVATADMLPISRRGRGERGGIGHGAAELICARRQLGHAEQQIIHFSQ